MMEDDRSIHSSLLDEHMENYNTETSALHRKLQSKIEALTIMREQLETFRTERDQFKLMAETLQLRYSALRRNTDYTKLGFEGKSSVLTLLNETREKNLKLTTEVESLKQKLIELQGDIQILRTRNTNKVEQYVTIDKLNSEEVDWKNEKSNFIQHLETLKKKNAQLSYDLRGVLDEKEEAVTERDAYKCKAHRLNHELQIALKANEFHPIVDVDGLILENKYLQEKLKNCENELKITHQCVTKYKSMLETKRKKGIIKLGSNNASIMSHKQVKTLLENNSELPSKTETIADLKSLCLALLDNLNDKNVALSHQKKTNKILAARIAELEKRIQMISGKLIAPSSSTFSPSEILLHGYCSSTVDNEPKLSSNITDDSGTMSSDESNKTSHATYDGADDDDDDNDDGMDSLSTESNRSIISSEYGTSSIDFNQITSVCGLNGDNNHKVKNTDSSPLIKERLEDLKDLPADLAEMVQKALEELDSKEEEGNENLKCDTTK